MKQTDKWHNDRLKRAYLDSKFFVPELEDVQIHQNIRHLGLIPSIIVPSLMNTTPHAHSLIASSYKGKDVRQYAINVNRGKRNDAILEDIPYGGLVFWNVHEHLHVSDFEGQSLGELVKFGLTYIPKYLIKDHSIKNIEQRINLEAISRGLASQFLELGKGLLSSKNIPHFYKDKLKKEYVPSWEQLEPFAKVQGIDKAIYDNILKL